MDRLTDPEDGPFWAYDPPVSVAPHHRLIRNQPLTVVCSNKSRVRDEHAPCFLCDQLP